MYLPFRSYDESILPFPDRSKQTQSLNSANNFLYRLLNQQNGYSTVQQKPNSNFRNPDQFNDIMVNNFRENPVYRDLFDSFLSKMKQLNNRINHSNEHASFDRSWRDLGLLNDKKSLLTNIPSDNNRIHSRPIDEDIYQHLNDQKNSPIPIDQLNQTVANGDYENSLIENLKDNQALKKSIDWVYRTVTRILNELRTSIPEQHKAFVVNLLDRLLVGFDKTLNTGNTYFNYFNYNFSNLNDQANKRRTGGSTLLKKTKDLIISRSYQVVNKSLDLIKYGFQLICENELIDKVSVKFKFKFAKDLLCNFILTIG